MYLTPSPSSSDKLRSWEDVQRRHYTILDVSRAEELLETVEVCDVNEMQTEWILLVVETFRQTCLEKKKNDVVKKFFLASKGKVAVIVFEDWRRHAMKRMEARLNRKESVDNTAELFLLVSILDFIADCNVVKRRRTLQELKKRGADWKAGVEEVSEYRYRSSSLWTSMDLHLSNRLLLSPGR